MNENAPTSTTGSQGLLVENDAPTGDQPTDLSILSRYLDLGWRIFPLHSVDLGACTCGRADCASPGKHPRTRNGVKDATSDPEVVRRWWTTWPTANWGVACGPASDLLVVDVDRRKGGYDSLDRLGDLPRTAVALTGGGGQHLYFRTADGLGNRVNWLPGVDVRSDGGYVVLPPGRHASGGRYAWREAPWEAPVAELPPSLAAQLAARPEPDRRPGDGGLIAGFPEGLRDEGLFRLACALRRKLDDDREAVTVLVIAAARRCDPPMPDRVALEKVEQAFRQDHADDLDPALASLVREWDGSERRAARLTARVVPGGSFVLDEPEHVPALWGTGEQVLWAEGEGLMLAGQQGSGKTTIAQQLVLAMLGIRPPELLGCGVKRVEGKVLYLAMDRPRQAARSLRRMVSAESRHDLDRLTVWRGPLPVNVLDGAERFADWCLTAEPDAAAVVVDSAKDLVPGISKDEVGAGLNSAWQELIARGVDLLVLHHERKASGEGRRGVGIDNVYGSTWLTSGMGSVVQILGEPGDETVALHHVKQPAEPVGPLTVFHDHATGTSSLAGQRPTPREAMEVAGPQGLTQRQLAELTGTSQKTASRFLTAMELEGSVKSVGSRPATYVWLRALQSGVQSGG